MKLHAYPQMAHRASSVRVAVALETIGLAIGMLVILFVVTVVLAGPVS